MRLFGFVLVPSQVYEGMLEDKRLLRKAMRTIIRMKVHGSSIPRAPRVAEKRDSVREQLMEVIDANPHAQRLLVRKALVEYLDKELRKCGGVLPPDKFAALAETLTNWSRRSDDTGDDGDGDAIDLDGEIALEFDDDSPRDQSLKANLTRGR